MGLETGTYINDLVVTNPDGASDPKSGGDDHLKLIKTLLKNTFPGMAGRAFRVQAKSGGYTAVANDNTSLIYFSVAATLALTAAATLGNGYMLMVYAGSGDVVIDPNGAETINGAASFTVPTGYMGIVMCDASGFYCALAAGSPVPAGVLFDYAGSGAVPTGYLLADGSAVSRTTYAALYAAIGTTWGVGDGVTTFNLPDTRRRVTIGSGGSAVASPANTVGSSGGSETHALSTAELASHQHVISLTTGGQSADHSHEVPRWQQLTGAGAGYSAQPGTDTYATGGASNDHTHAVSGNSNAAGSGTAHNNMQPSIVVQKIIKT